MTVWNCSYENVNIYLTSTSRKWVKFITVKFKIIYVAMQLFIYTIYPCHLLLETASKEWLSESLKFLSVEGIVLLRLPEAESREENG